MIDKENLMPVWMQVKTIMEAELADMQPGQRLPSIRTYMQRFEVSDGTIKRVLKDLQAQGLVTSYQGKGFFKA